MQYKLKDLENMVQLKARSLKLRMKTVKEKYKFNDDLLYKKGNRWYIDESIIFEFDRKRKNLDGNQYKSFVSISFDGSRSVDVINEIMNMVFTKLKPEFNSIEIFYVIELNWNQNNHLHFITNIIADKINQKKIYNSFKVFGVNFDMRPITNYRNLESYLNKSFVYKKFLQYP